MRKKAVKNFVYSFLFSLLAVAAVGKVFFRAPETPKNQTGNKVIKTQDISLFSKPKDLTVRQVAAATAVDVSAIEDLTAPTPAADVAAPKEALEQKPEVLAENTVTATSQTVIKSPINTDLAAAQEIVLEPEEIASAQVAAPAYEQSGIVYADISDTLQDEKTQNIILSKPSEPLKVLYAPEDKDINAENIVVAENTVTDNAALSVAPLEDNEIPLVETSGTLHKQIEVQNSASGSEIAMLEPNVLVNTIEEAEAPEEKTLAEADLKQNEWQQMSEKQPEESPWVVAKGNRFAKNKAVVEQFAQSEQPLEETPVAAEKEADESQPKPEEQTSLLRPAAEDENISLALKEEDGNISGGETKVAYQWCPTC